MYFKSHLTIRMRPFLQPLQLRDAILNSAKTNTPPAQKAFDLIMEIKELNDPYFGEETYNSLKVVCLSGESPDIGYLLHNFSILLLQIKGTSFELFSADGFFGL